MTVAPTSNCAVTVVFAPTAPGSRSAALNVTDNAAGSPQHIAVTGTATNFQLAAITGGSTSVSITAGETATFNLQVTPMNGFSGAVALSCSNPTPASTCTVGPTSVNVSGGSASGFTVTVTTTAPPSTTYLAPLFTYFRGRHVKIVDSLGLLVLLFALVIFPKRRKEARRLRPAWFLLAGLLLASCGGGSPSSSGSATPAGTYNLTVAGTVPGLTSPKAIGLTVTVQ